LKNYAIAQLSDRLMDLSMKEDSMLESRLNEIKKPPHTDVVV